MGAIAFEVKSGGTSVLDVLPPAALPAAALLVGVLFALISAPAAELSAPPTRGVVSRVLSTSVLLAEQDEGSLNTGLRTVADDLYSRALKAEVDLVSDVLRCAEAEKKADLPQPSAQGAFLSLLGDDEE